MIGISRRVGRAAMWARVARYRDLPPYGWSTRNVGRTALDFQCSIAAINGLLERAGHHPNRGEYPCFGAAHRLEQKENFVNAAGWDDGQRLRTDATNQEFRSRLHRGATALI
jgi:hypothetical protein